MDRSLPSDIQSERAVIGSALIDRDAIVAVDGWLMPEFFYLEQNAIIYSAIQTVYRRKIPPDVVSVQNELQRIGKLEAVGGLLYLVELSNETPTSTHIAYYGGNVKRAAISRRLIAAGGTIAGLGFDERDDIADVLAKAESTLSAITQTAVERDYVPMSVMSDAYWARLRSIQENGASASGVKSGFVDIDEVTGGFQRSDLITVAARPAVGKTSLALNVAEGAAQSDAKVGIVSLEMSKEQLFERLISMNTSINLQHLRNGRLDRESLECVMQAVARLNDMPILIDDSPGQTLSQVRAKARRLHAQHGLDMLMIDYLQLMYGDKRAENRVQEVAQISRGLKELARELSIPVIALSQLSRSVEQRASKVPMLSDLRESGSIEQDSDIVMFIYREELYDKETDKKGIAEIHIAKHRNGPTAVVPLRFDPNATKFHNLDRYHTPEGY
jgi:replicative DNA helicase